MGIKNKLALFLIIFIGNFGSLSLHAQVDSSKAYEYKGVWVKDLVIEKGRTLYNLSKSFNTTQEELYRLNPELKDGLKLNMTIKVPVDKPGETLEEKKTEIPRLQGALKHTVKRKESVYSIARMYGVTTDDIYAINPQAKDGIKPGMELTVYPRPTVQPEKPVIVSVIDTLQAGYMKKENSWNERSCPQNAQVKPGKVLKVSLLLPFYLPAEEPLSARARIGLDFYGGAKMAIDSLKKEGFLIDIHVFDTQSDSSSISGLLTNTDFLSSDLIIGPLYSSTFLKVAKKAKELSIPAVAPFAQSDALLDGYPNVIKVTPNTKDQITTLVPALKKKFPGAKFILLDSELSKDQKLNQAFKLAWNDSSTLNNVNELHYITHSQLKANDAGFDFVKQNIVIFLSSDEVKVIDVSTRLDKIKETYRLHLVGLNEWNALDNVDYELLNALHYTYASPVNIDFDSGSSIRFQKHYRNEFKGEPSYYSYQGFDVTYFFTKQTAKYGTDLTTCLNKLDPICLFNTCYKFRTPNSSTGLENRFVNILVLEDFKALPLD